MYVQEAKAKKVKDPNAPKRPLSAYFIYLADQREAFKKAHPGCSVTDVTKGVADQWKKVSEKEKAKYTGKAAALKEQYTKAVEEYNEVSKGETFSTKSYMLTLHTHTLLHIVQVI